MLGRAAAALVRAYQLTAGRLMPSRCRFVPSCSEYAREALAANGLVRGLVQTTWRLLRCAPWSAGGYDPVRPARLHPVRSITHRLLHREVHNHG